MPTRLYNIKMTRLFAILQASLLASASIAVEQQISEEPLACSPDLVQDFDFTMDGHIGKVEFIQLLEELAPPTCDVVRLWQTKNAFQSALDDLSCLCTEFGGSQDANCCDSSSQPVFAVQGKYNEAYDHAVCERVEEVLRVECF